MIKLFGKPIKVNKASQDKRTQEVGANLFIGNLDPEVDEKMLYDTFSSFGMILSTKVQSFFFYLMKCGILNKIKSMKYLICFFAFKILLLSV